MGVYSSELMQSAPGPGFEIILDVEAEIGALFVEERHGLSPLDSIARTAFSAVPTSNMQEDWQNSPLSQPPETVKPGVGARLRGEECCCCIAAPVGLDEDRQRVVRWRIAAEQDVFGAPRVHAESPQSGPAAHCGWAARRHREISRTGSSMGALIGASWRVAA